jgi:hypothetical protein
MTHDQIVAALRRGYQLDDARESRRGCSAIRERAPRTKVRRVATILAIGNLAVETAKHVLLTSEVTPGPAEMQRCPGRPPAPGANGSRACRTRYADATRQCAG